MTRNRRASISLGLISLLSLFGEGLGSARVKPAADQARAARITYLKEHALPVRSIDAEDIDFADLEPLREVIGGRKHARRRRDIRGQMPPDPIPP